MKVSGILLVGVTYLLCRVGKAAGQTYNQSFVPWTVMGPVSVPSPDVPGVTVLHHGDRLGHVEALPI